MRLFRGHVCHSGLNLRTWSLVFCCVLASFFPTRPQWGQSISTHHWGLWRDLQWPYQRSSNAHWPIGWMCFVGCVSIRRQPADKKNHFHHHYGQSLLSWQLNNINDPFDDRTSKCVINDIKILTFNSRSAFAMATCRSRESSESESVFWASEPLRARKLSAGDSSPCNWAIARSRAPSRGLPSAKEPDRPVE